MAKAGHRTAMVERKYLGGSCPNVACLPSKNLIYSAKIASLVRRGAELGVEIDSLSVNRAAVQRRKRIMVEGLHQFHVDREVASGGELKAFWRCWRLSPRKTRKGQLEIGTTVGAVQDDSGKSDWPRMNRTWWKNVRQNRRQKVL
jgi:hypothetical protein